MSDIRLVFDTFNPTIEKERLSDTFWHHANKSNKITIAVGYVSSEAIIELQGYIERNSSVHLNLFIGMQFIEGFSPSQIHAVDRLSQTLKERSQGEVLVSKKVKHHAKLYYFNIRPEFRAELGSAVAYIGSANLGAISNNYNATFETGILLPDANSTIFEHIERDILPLGSPFRSSEVKAKKQDKSPLVQYDEATAVSDEYIEQILATKPSFSFTIPIKTAPKSNLNVFHGAPRINKLTNRALPRPWYEVELIPGKKVSASPGYPQQGAVFNVVTDDNWHFECVTNGDYNKNLRSAGNLTVLGAWLKGRLESHGALKVGDKVADETLIKYGRSSFEMTYYPANDVWYFDFNNQSDK